MDKLIAIINQLEEKLSQLLMKLYALVLFPFQKLFKLLIPIFEVISIRIQSCIRYIIQSAISFVQILNSMVGPRAWNYYRHKIQNFMQKVKEEKAEKIKLLQKKDKKQNLSGETVAEKKRSFTEDIALLFDAFVNKLSNISPVKFALMGLLFLVLLLNSFHFLTSSTDLAITINEDKSAIRRREIASTLEVIPIYYNDIARISSIKSLKIPAYASKINKIKNLELDTHILFYNRSGKQFFDESVIIFLDHLEMTLEPIQPSFPLSPEGKMVIKEKIKYEINAVFKEQGVDSRVENIFFTNIFAN